MSSAWRRLLFPLWVFVAVTAARDVVAQTHADIRPPAQRLHIVRDGGNVDATCVLVRRDQREHDVVLYFVTAGHLFKDDHGLALPDARSLTVDIGEGNALRVLPRDVTFPRGHIVDIAVLKVTLPTTSLVPPALTVATPRPGGEFWVSGFDATGTPVRVIQRVRRVATLMITGDRTLAAIDGCAGAPAIGEDGVFGIVSSCKEGQVPVIVPLSAVASWIERCVPGGLTGQRPVQTRLEFVPRQPGTTPVRHLLYNGRPLTRLLYPADVAQNAFAAGGRQQPGGHITGVALDAIGKPLANHDVTLRLSGQLEVIATTTTDASGRFAFSALNRGIYFVEVGMGQQVVVAGGPIRVTEGTMTFAQVGGPRVSSTRHRKGVLYWTALGAGVGGGIGLLTTFREECRSPDSLCPLALPAFGMMGAFMGFFIGLGN